MIRIEIEIDLKSRSQGIFQDELFPLNLDSINRRERLSRKRKLRGRCRVYARCRQFVAAVDCRCEPIKPDQP